MTILDMIGNTPLMNIDNVYFKLEMFNPSGSIKDRIAFEMLKNLKPGTQIIEATSGNTGISFAMVSAALGLGCRICCPSGTSLMKRKLMKAYGATVTDCQWVNGKMHFSNNLQDCINAIKRSKGFTYLDQFSNPLNVKAQEKMAIEAKYPYSPKTRQYVYPNKFDAIVAGIGTGGTLMGLHNIFPEADVYTVISYNGKIEGICDGVATPLVPKNLKHEVLVIHSQVAFNTAAMLAKKYGIHCGVSSGANYCAAESITYKYKRILTVFPDSGARYL